jgi:hypothetical protein
MSGTHDTMMGVIEGLIQSRNDFLNNRTIRAFPFQQRANVVNRFMINEHYLLESASLTYNNTIALRNAATTLITLSMANNNFMEPVIVSASAQQIQGSLESEANATGQCSICQENNNANSVRIRQCGHVHHRNCIEDWLAMSVRCPVCRHDIREEGLAAQTSSAASQTSSQPSVQ